MSTTTKFTPGPWVVSKLIGVDDLGIVNVYGSAVARIGNLDIANPANAALIAAAPELYEALEWAINEIRNKNSYVTARQRLVLFDQASAALDKARGEPRAALAKSGAPA